MSISMVWGISYDEIQRINTKWAEIQMSQDIFVLANMVEGNVPPGAGNNYNRATESLDWIHHDVVNMVLYQIHSQNQGSFGAILQDIKSVRFRTINKDFKAAKIL